MPLVLVAVKSALTLRNPAGHARFGLLRSTTQHRLILP
jgi:hypothetical protein